MSQILLIQLFDRIVALKRIFLHNEETLGFPLTSLREINILKQCQHPNIVQLLDIMANEKKHSIYIVLEFCDFDLSALIRQYKNPFNESQVKTLIMQLLSALQYLHQHDIIHRDIKLSNLLYNSVGQLKLADFGLSRKCTTKTKDLTSVVVTLHYRAPELLMNCTNYNYAIDIWAAGCVLFELLTNEVLFQGDKELDQLLLIFSILGAPSTALWPEINTMPLITSNTISLSYYQMKYPYNELNERLSRLSPQGYDLINRCLAYSPIRRISTKDALVHAYFASSPVPTEAALMPTFKK